MMRILFVCTGNTCRSPMAEALLKSTSLNGVEVKSAGIFAAPGSEASVNTIKVLEENGIPQNHRSSLLTETEIEWATYILTLTASHKAAVINKFPNAAGKTFTLKEFAGGMSGSDIADPFGGPVEIYRATFLEIQAAVDRIVEKLQKEIN